MLNSCTQDRQKLTKMEKLKKFKMEPRMEKMKLSPSYLNEMRLLKLAKAEKTEVRPKNIDTPKRFLVAKHFYQ